MTTKKESNPFDYSDPPHCEYTDQTGRVSPWYDRSVTLISLEAAKTSALSECRRLCDTERDFLCKSVSVQLRSRSPLCLLSSDDSVSLNGANGVNSLMPDREFTYSERSSCSNGKAQTQTNAALRIDTPSLLILQTSLYDFGVTI